MSAISRRVQPPPNPLIRRCTYRKNASRCCSPLLPMSIPAASCLRTTSVSAALPSASSSAASTASPWLRRTYSSVSAAGRGRLPVWVVRIRPSLFSTPQSLRARVTSLGDGQRPLQRQVRGHLEHKVAEEDTAPKPQAEAEMPTGPLPPPNLGPLRGPGPQGAGENFFPESLSFGQLLQLGVMRQRQRDQHRQQH